MAMRIDSHMHLSKPEVSQQFGPDLVGHVERTMGRMAAQDIAMGIVAHGLPAATLDQVVARYGSTFKGLLYVWGQGLAQNLAEIEQYGENPNIIGIKVYPNSFENSDFRRALEPILASIAGKRWLIQVHSNPVVASDLSIPLQVVEFADDVDLPVVMVHTGGHQFLQLAGALEHGVPRNLYFDTSMVQNLFCDSPLRKQLEWLLGLVPEDRLLWGSDYPEFPFGDALAALSRLGFGEADSERICWHNPMKLLRDHTETSLPTGPATEGWQRRSTDWTDKVVFRTAGPAPDDFDGFTFFWGAPEVAPDDAEVEWGFILPDGTEHIMHGCRAGPPGTTFRTDVCPDHPAGDARQYRGRQIRMLFRSPSGRIRLRGARYEFAFHKANIDGDITWRKPFRTVDAIT